MRTLGKLLFSMWAIGALLLGAYAMGAHSVVFPNALARTETDAALSTLLDGHGGVVHVLYAKCKCSGAILDYLEGRSARPSETVLVVGDLGARRTALARRGYRVVETTADELEKKYAIGSAPLLVVAANDGRIRYRGGYRDSEFGPLLADELIRASLEPVETKARPLFGCAVSETLKRIVDPFALKD